MTAKHAMQPTPPPEDERVRPSDRSALRKLLEERARKPKSLPVSFAQQRLWFLDQLQPGSPQYNVHQAMRLRGTLDPDCLERALQEIIRRHETLRTTFQVHGDEPHQIVAAAPAFVLGRVDLTPEPDPEKREAAMLRRAEQDAMTPFDLSRGPLLRAELVALADDDHVLLLAVHHIVSDGWSMAVLIRECAAVYLANVAGAPSPLPKLAIQYADFAVWQRKWLDSQGLSGQLAYWRERLAGASGVLDLPTSRPRPAALTGQGSRHDFEIDLPVTQALRTLARAEGATLYMILLASFAAFLSRAAGQTDVVVGSPIANRNRPELEGLIGLFVNTLPLRISLADNPRFVDLLAQVKERALEAYTHPDIPFEKLLDELRVPRAPNRTPLFQAAFVLQNTPPAEAAIPGIRLTPIEIASHTAKFDLLLELTETPRGLCGNWEYSTDLFDAATIARMVSHWRSILDAVVSDETTRILDLPLLSAAEREQLVYGFNRTAKDYPRDVCVHALFEAQASRTPDAIAMISGTERLTYRELNERSNRLAHGLRARGLVAGERVATMMDRSEWAAVALIGTLKAGGVYVPIDPDWPEQRTREVLDSVGARVVLTTRARLHDLQRAHGAGPRFQWLALDSDGLSASALDDFPSGNPAATGFAEGEAYIIFTSGSTGKPKGVVVPHRPLVNMILDINRTFGIGAADRLLFADSLSFDLSIYDMLGPLLAGGTVVVAPPAVAREPQSLVELLTGGGITVWHSATALFLQLVSSFPDGTRPHALRLVFLGGELLPLGLPAEVSAAFPGARVVNVGGATETTVWSNHYMIDQVEPEWTSIPYGRPLANAQYHVLDGALNPCPIGVRGDLFIAGECLSLGYAGDPALTAAKFIPNPFSRPRPRPRARARARARQPGARMYRTGDLARYLPDGNLEFIGRADHQVKIRGFRIELGEIESVLLTHPKVRDCAVLAKQEGAGANRPKRLVAYVGLREKADKEVTTEALRELVAHRLPSYMMPAVFVLLDALPLTGNGKVDRSALPEPPPTCPRELVLPRTPLEAQLAAIWSDVLRVESVGVTQNFFDAGGDSLLATQLMARIRRELEVDLPLRALFDSPTVAALASAIPEARESPGHASSSSIVALERRGNAPPLFWVHPIGGSVFCYSELARAIGGDQPFFAFSARGIDGEAAPRDRIEAMAAAYLADMRLVQPAGPYHLGGWSMGGVIAFEMAQQLIARNEHVASLVLLDSHPRPLGPVRVEHDFEPLDAVVADLCGLLAGPAPEPFAGEAKQAYAARLMRTAIAAETGLAADRAERLDVQPLLRTFESHIRALMHYQPRVYPGRIVLIEASLHDNTLYAAWRPLIAAELEHHTVPTDHYGVVKSPHVRAVAAFARQRLRPSKDRQ